MFSFDVYLSSVEQLPKASALIGLPAIGRLIAASFWLPWPTTVLPCAMPLMPYEQTERQESEDSAELGANWLLW